MSGGYADGAEVRGTVRAAQRRYGIDGADEPSEHHRLRGHQRTEEHVGECRLTSRELEASEQDCECTLCDADGTWVLDGIY